MNTTISVVCPETFSVNFNRGSIPRGSSKGVIGALGDDLAGCVRDKGVSLKVLGDPTVAHVQGNNVVVADSSTARTVKVRATINGSPDCYRDFDLPISDCGGGCGSGNCGVGGGSAKLGSVDVRFDMGKDLEGESIGDMWIYGAMPTASMGTPAALRFDVVRPDVDVVRDSNGIRQVLAPASLTDVTVDSSSKFTIRYYGYTSPPTKDQQTNLYTPTGQPFVRWEVEYPSDGVLRVRKLDASGTLQMSYEYVGTTGFDWHALLLKTLDSSNAIVTQESETWTANLREHGISNGAGTLAFHETEIYSSLPTGLAVTERVVDPSGAHLVTTREFSSSGADVGLLKSETRPDGSWSNYTYDSLGRVATIIESWEDEAPTTSPSSVRSTEYTYFDSEHPFSDEEGSIPVVGVDRRPRIITEKVDNVVTAKTYIAYVELPNSPKQRIEKRCTVNTAAYGDSSNLVTLTVYDQTNEDRVTLITYPNGTTDTFEYDAGTINLQDRTFQTDIDGPNLRVRVTHANEDVQPVNSRSTRSSSYTDRAGRILFEEDEASVLVESVPQWKRYQWTQTDYDSEGRVTNVVRSNHTSLQIDRSDCCFTETATDEVGMQSTIVRDAAGRVVSQSRTGESDNNPIVTQFTLDGAGRVLASSESSGGLTRTSSQTFDQAGQLLTSTDESGLVTQYAYSTTSGGGRMVTVTRPNAATEITEYYRDGRPHIRHGTGVLSTTYSYNCELDGSQWSREAVGETASNLRWTQSWTDMVGRRLREAKPGFLANSLTATYYTYYTSSGYPSSARVGQLARKYSTSVLANPNGYVVSGGGGGGEEGEGEITNVTLYRSIPIGGGGIMGALGGGAGWILSPSGADTIYEYDQLGGLLREATRLTEDNWTEASPIDPSIDRPKMTETFFDLWNGDSNQVVRRTTTSIYPVSSAQTVSEVAEHLTGLSQYETSRTSVADVSGNVVVSSRTVASGTKAVTDTTYLGAAMSVVVGQSVSQNGLTRSVTSRSGNTTEFQYDALGRQTFAHDPRHTVDGTKYWSETHYNSAQRVDYVKDALGNQTNYEYDSAGQLCTITNAAGKKTNFAYDSLGRMTQTWGDVPQPVWIEYDPVYGDRTKLHTYRTNTSGLWSQTSWPSGAGDGDVTTWAYHAPTGLLTTKTYADNTHITYGYSIGGQLVVRYWARSSGSLRTEYGYDPKTGELLNIDYSDSTPDVEFTYDHLGRQATVSDAVGLHSFTYTSADLKLWKEEISGSSALHTRTLTRTYDSTTANEKGRLVSLSAGSDYTVDYGYDSYGRLDNVRGPGLPGDGSAGTGVVYTFVTNSDLVEETRFMSDGSTVAGRATREFEPLRDLITAIENKWGSTVVSDYAYANDNLARRTSVVRTGPAFDSNRVELWDYNERNELTSARTYAGTDPDNPGTEATDRARTYNYDPIGNRTTASEGGDSITYTPNNLNQYTAIQRSTTVNPTYDADGNLKNDGTLKYEWDAENRLISVEPVSPTTSDVQLQFDYDFMNRRVRKRTFAWTGSAWNSTAASDTRYVYDEWNLLIELNGLSSNAVLRKYTWGLDLAGQNDNAVESSLHEAGGIGGLLGCYDANGTPTTTDDKALVYFYDANGNVGQLIEPASGNPATTPAARYEYDPYGQTIVAVGDFASANPFRFGSKYLLAGFELLDYGRRFYNPRSSNWTSRDPIGEFGGPNLYCALLNNPSNLVDPNGDAPRSSVPTTSAPSTQPAAGDTVKLWCYTVGRTPYFHCDVQCIRPDGTSYVDGGTGFWSSGKSPGGNDHPGWKTKPGIDPVAIFAGAAKAPAGTCDCIRRKGAALNRIPDKNYDEPVLPELDGNISNSNAAASTLLRCCGLTTLKPSKVSGWGGAPGWGDKVEYSCCKTAPTRIVSPRLTVNGRVKQSCFVECDMLGK